MARPVSRYSRPRALVLLALHALIAAHIAHFFLAGRTIAPLELNEALHTVHGGILTLGFVLLALSVVSVLIFGRFFCGWGCHLLALQDLAGWGLERLGIAPRPFRSRALALVPLLFLLYLFAWPQLARVLAGGTHPGFRVVDEGAWTSFSTSDFFRNLPTIDVAVTTLLVCGFVTVFVLGSRGFCRLACPYGALYAIADRFARRRIVLSGDCDNCGKCTAVCRSDIRVHSELTRHGRVVDSGCLKDLDCVSVCPKGAIQFGKSKAGLVSLRGSDKPVEAGTVEEVLIGLAFFGAFLATRGLYDLVPVTLALGLGTATGWIASTSFRLWTKDRLAFRKIRLKTHGKLTLGGAAFAAFTAAWCMALAHSGWVRFHDFEADRILRAATPSNRVEALPRAIDHLEATLEYGWVRPLSTLRKLASARAAIGRSRDAASALEEILTRAPSDEEAARRLRKLSELRPSQGDSHE